MDDGGVGWCNGWFGGRGNRQELIFQYWLLLAGLEGVGMEWVVVMGKGWGMGMSQNGMEGTGGGVMEKGGWAKTSSSPLNPWMLSQCEGELSATRSDNMEKASGLIAARGVLVIMEIV